MTLRLGFYGGAGTVTGSRFLLDTGGRRLLIDCGLFQGLKALRLLNWEPTPFDPRSVDAVVLTHAHIDHSGYLPRLAKAGFSGPIYCSPATRDLAPILLLDAAKLQEEDAAFLNRHGLSKHHPALPLFEQADAAAAARLLRAQAPGVPFDAAGYRVWLHGSGHILGSSFAEVLAGDQRLVFSGDLGRYGAPLHPDPEPLPHCDTLVLESTYGDRVHPRAELAERLLPALQETVRQGGTVLIPAFAVARAQLVMLMLKELMDAGRLPRLPIHIDSPMATDVTAIYRRYAKTGEVEATREELFPRGVTFHRTVEESKELNRLAGPRIIISASGMLTGGRVLHHLKRLAPDSRNLLVLVGYQAAGTRGRAILEGARTVRVHGEDVPLAMRFIDVHGLSAHADASDLARWVRSAPGPPATVFLTHGEPAALQALAARLGRPATDVIVPGLNESFRLEGDAWRRERGSRA